MRLPCSKCSRGTATEGDTNDKELTLDLWMSFLGRPKLKIFGSYFFPEMHHKLLDYVCSGSHHKEWGKGGMVRGLFFWSLCRRFIENSRHTLPA